MIMQMNLPPEFDLDLFWHFEGVKSGGQQPCRASQRIAARLLPEASCLANPVVYFQSFEVRCIQKKCLELENGVCFSGRKDDHPHRGFPMAVLSFEENLPILSPAW